MALDGRCFQRAQLRIVAVIGAGLMFIQTAGVLAQLPPEQQAQQLLETAHRALNEQQYDVAIARYREFLQRFGNHPQANQARYGLGVALVEGSNRDYKAALEALQPLLGQADFAFHPWAVYYFAWAQRGLGRQALREAHGKPPDALANAQREAQARFEQAAKYFQQSAELFAKRVESDQPSAENKAEAKPGAQAPGAAVPPAGHLRDWLARARCDQAEMLLQVNQPKEALAAVLSLLNDPAQAKSPFRSLARYYEGQARLLLGDYVGAGKALAELAPFRQPAFGLHARYLLARVHHELGDRPEAAGHYEQVISGYEALRQDAAKMLQNPASFRNDPDERWRWEMLAKQPPEFVLRAGFYRGLLFYEEGQFSEAATRWEALLKQNPPAALQAETQLRLGMAQVQSRQFDQAVKTLSPLENHPVLAEQALWWLGRAHAGAATATVPVNEGRLQSAIQTLRRALDRNAQRGNDPEARLRRTEILLDLGDALQSARQYKEAASTYAVVIQEKVHPQRVEEAWARQALALHLAGAWKESDDVCRRFREAYPKSVLLPGVLFCAAQNSYFLASQLAKEANNPEREKQLRELLQQTIARHRELLEQYPEFSQKAAASFTLGVCLYRLGEFAKAQEAFAAIPQADRTGALLMASYYEADCLIRLAPSDTSDALSAGRAQEAFTQAAKLLAAFTESAGKASPYTPEALLKLAYCYRRLAELIVEPKERATFLQQARQTCERFFQTYPNHPLLGAVVLERANCLSLQGDTGGASNEWQRFLNDPLARSEVAPLALVRLAQHYRSQNRAADAVKLLETARQRYEASLTQDSSKHDWLAQLLYQHGLALQEANKWPEARAVFESVIKRFGHRREGVESAWRIGQVRLAQATASLKPAVAVLTDASSKPEQRSTALAAAQKAAGELRETAAYFVQLAGEKTVQEIAPDLVPRLHYESAWCWRELIPFEREQARQQRLEVWQKKQPPPAKDRPPRRPPDVSLADIPLQPSEQQARQAYQTAIQSAGDSPLALEAMFELAELLAERQQHEQAIALLRQLFDREPPAELVEKVHLRLAACLLASGDAKSALQHAQTVLQNQKSPHVPWARYLAAECYLQLGGKENAQQAVSLLSGFRDHGPWQQLAGLSDRALLRLSAAYAVLGQWGPSRQASEILIQRFPQSPHRSEAQFAIGWAWQNENNLDAAIQAYSQVLGLTYAEPAARAQLQIARCRALQKRWPDAIQAYLLVHLTYDYPELAGQALWEAAEAAQQNKQPEQAQRLLQQLLNEYPQTKAAQLARQRLERKD